MNKPPQISEAPKSFFQNIQGICFDIDDTFSSHGKIKPDAFQSLWDLKNAGFFCIPVTGRPAGWCDHIARFWPVDAIVGENGAFTMTLQGGKLIRQETLPQEIARQAREKLTDLAKAIQQKFPEAKFASDQDYRNYDIAIDICEDVAPWPEVRVQELLDFCAQKGAIAKLSSIHVNTWFGRYTKVDGLRKCISEIVPGAPNWDRWIYIGDSPNDEPMFQAFQKSIGVANLEPYLGKINHSPTYMTKHEAGQGFQEMAQYLLKR